MVGASNDSGKGCAMLTQEAKDLFYKLDFEIQPVALKYCFSQPEDFERVNSVLFPKGADALEVYEWTTDWSNYFDAGHEWWGAACWSAYDRHLDRFAVLFASATD